MSASKHIYVWLFGLTIPGMIAVMGVFTLLDQGSTFGVAVLVSVMSAIFGWPVWVGYLLLMGKVYHGKCVCCGKTLEEASE